MQSQRICGLDHIFPHLGVDHNKESAIATWIEEQRHGSILRSSTTFNIPVVIHVVYFTEEENISDEIIYEQLDVLNKVFAKDIETPPGAPAWVKALSSKTGFQFCLAKTDPEGNPSTGITRTQTPFPFIGMRRSTMNQLSIFYDDLGGKTPWNNERYLNIYVCSMLPQILGYATLPTTATFPQEDGIVMNVSHFGRGFSGESTFNRAICHEIGHYFNLYHPWGLEEGCQTDDFVMDTPLQEKPYFNCPEHPQFSCNSADIVYNIMDYVQSSCSFVFTPGQVMRMKASLALFRSGLVNELCENNPNTGESNTPMLIYPNPVNVENVLVRWTLQRQSPRLVSVFSADGKLIDQTKGNQTGIYTFEVKNWTPGLYFIQAVADEKIYYGKLMVR